MLFLLPSHPTAYPGISILHPPTAQINMAQVRVIMVRKGHNRVLFAVKTP